MENPQLFQLAKPNPVQLGESLQTGQKQKVKVLKQMLPQM